MTSDSDKILTINQSLKSFVKENTQNLWAHAIHEGLKEAYIQNALVRQMEGHVVIITSDKVGPFILAFVFDSENPESITGGLHPSTAKNRMAKPIAVGQFLISTEAVREFVMDCFTTIVDDYEDALLESGRSERPIDSSAILVGEKLLILKTGTC